MNLGIIPARGGSKRLPGKNLRRIHGVSLVSLAAQCAREAGLDQVILSSDSEEILLEGQKEGILLSRRPECLAADSTSMEETVIYLLDRHYPRRDHTLVLLQPTSPFRSPEDVKEALWLFEDQRTPAIVSVGEDLSPNGAVYVISQKLLEGGKTFYPLGWHAMRMPDYRSLDVDTEGDWTKALEQSTLNWDG